MYAMHMFLNPLLSPDAMRMQAACKEGVDKASKAARKR